MLYWICPECGGECSPAIRECPACAGTPAISPASTSPAQRKPVVTEQVLALAQNFQPAPIHAVANRLITDNGHSVTAATLELPETPAPQTVAPPTLAEDEPCTPPKEAIESLVRPLIESTTLAPPPEPAPEPLAPEVLSDAMALQAELVLDSMAQQSIAEQSAIRGIVASFQQQPKTSLLPPASEDVVAPAPVCIQWMRIPRPHISPVPPRDLNQRDLLSGIQTPPLAGPCVPLELRSLTEQRGPAPHQAPKKAGLPAWTVSFLVALTLFLGVGSLLQYLGANRDAKAAAASAPPSGQSVSTVASGEQPASKLVEVTGLRIAAGSNHRPQLEFIVVNHSGTALSDIGLQIAVRSASSTAGVAPLFRVSTTVASLGPYQSREFRAELDPEVHATDVPDWQSLRADVRITQ
jgi:hypothetical protein